MDSTSPKVLISYTHDSREHKARVVALCERLRNEGVDCHIDQYEYSPPQGWPRWMQDEIDAAEYVLVVCTETYNRRFLGHEEPGRGLGAQWEGAAITQDLYEQGGRNDKFIPIVFSDEDSEFIPRILRGATYYPVYTEDGYEDLYRRLTRQPRVKKAPLGKRRVLDHENIGLTKAGSEASKGAGGQVTEKIATHTAARTDSGNSKNLVLLYLAENNFAFIPAGRIEKGERLILDLVPSNARESAFLKDLQPKWHKPTIGLAFGSDAFYGVLEKAVNVHEGTEEHWRLELKVIEEGFGQSVLDDFSFNGYSADDMADLRARRILLNERSDVPRRGGSEDSFIEARLRRGTGLVETVRPPIPFLFEHFRSDPKPFIDAARLMCILYLKATGTVEHIFALNLRMNGSDEVAVEFEGQRRPRYVEAKPVVIKFKGNCPLS